MAPIFFTLIIIICGFLKILVPLWILVNVFLCTAVFFVMYLSTQKCRYILFVINKNAWAQPNRFLPKGFAFCISVFFFFLEHCTGLAQWFTSLACFTHFSYGLRRRDTHNCVGRKELNGCDPGGSSSFWIGWSIFFNSFFLEDVRKSSWVLQHQLLIALLQRFSREQGKGGMFWTAANFLFLLSQMHWLGVKLAGVRRTRLFPFVYLIY